MGEIYTDLHLGPLYQRPRFGRAFYSSPKAERHRFHDLPAGGLVQRDTFVAEAETLCDNGPLVLRTTRVRNHAALRAIATTHCYSRRRDRDAAFASITCRIPFYAGLTLLRIARNGWIGGHYSRRLLDEANKTLG